MKIKKFTRKNFKVIGIAILILAILIPLVVYAIEEYDTTKNRPENSTMPTPREIEGMYAADKIMLPNASKNPDGSPINPALHQYAYARWDGYHWVHSRFETSYTNPRIKELIDKGYDDQTPQDGSNEYNKLMNPKIPPVQEGVPGQDGDEYQAYEADYWGFFVLYLQYGTINVNYVDENNSPIKDKQVNQVKPREKLYRDDGTDMPLIDYTYNAENIDGYTYVSTDKNGVKVNDTTVTTTIDFGETINITFHYKKGSGEVVNPPDQVNLKAIKIEAFNVQGQKVDSLVKDSTHLIKVTASNTSNITSDKCKISLDANGSSLNVLDFPSLNANNETVLSFSYVPTETGKITLHSKIDSENTIVESNENDNEVSLDIDCIAKSSGEKGINLKPWNPRLETKKGSTALYEPNAGFVFVVTGYNTGDTASGACSTSLNYNSKDFILPTPIILPNSSVNLEIDNFRSDDKKIGVFKVFIDCNNEVKETNEDDNKVEATYATENYDPPVISIDAPKKVFVGDPVTVTANVSTQNTDVTRLKGTVNIKDSKGTDFTSFEGERIFKYDDDKSFSFKKDEIIFPKIGTYTAIGNAWDNTGKDAPEVKKDIEVVLPKPNVQIVQGGTTKENRKITIDVSGSTAGSKTATIDWSKAEWSITNKADMCIQTHTEGGTDGEILYDPSRGIDKSLANNQKIDLECKKVGTYQMNLKLTNSFGMSGEKRITIDISDDKPPKAGDTIDKSVGVRDPNIKDSNGNALSVFKITNNAEKAQDNYFATGRDNGTGCYSIDKDIIEKVGYIMVYDQNNNGTFDDDTCYIYTAQGEWLEVGSLSEAKKLDLSNIDTGNFKEVEFKTPLVGKYAIGIICKEVPGQEYIPQFFDKQAERTATNID